MFGIIYSLFASAVSIIGNVKNKIDDNDSKKRTYDPSNGTYRNREGSLIDSKTRQFVTISKNETGDRILESFGKIKIKRNLDHEERKANYRELIYNRPAGVTVALYNKDYDTLYAKCEKASKDKVAAGKWYIDLRNSKLYVERKFWMLPNGRACLKLDKKEKEKPVGLLTFYMDCKTGMITRVADGCFDEEKREFILDKMRGIIKSDLTPEEYIDKLETTAIIWINDFNNNQTDKMKKYNEMMPYMNETEREWFYDSFFHNYAHCL